MKIFAVIENHQEYPDELTYLIGKKIVGYFKSEERAQAEIEELLKEKTISVTLISGTMDLSGSLNEQTIERYFVQPIEVKD